MLQHTCNHIMTIALPDCELGATHSSLVTCTCQLWCLLIVCNICVSGHTGVGCSGMIWMYWSGTCILELWTVHCFISITSLYVVVAVTLYANVLSWVNVCNHLHNNDNHTHTRNKPNIHKFTNIQTTISNHTQHTHKQIQPRTHNKHKTIHECTLACDGLCMALCDCLLCFELIRVSNYTSMITPQMDERWWTNH